MATDNPQVAPQPAMEDILSSIRTTMAEETAKVGTGSADLIDAAAAQDGAEDDVLELSAADMVAAPASNAEADELIDIAAFGSTGDAKTVSAAAAADLAADILGETPAAAPEGGAGDEFDRLLAEISQEQQQQVAAAEVSKQALMDEEEPLGADAMAEDDAVSEAIIEPVAEAVEEAVVAGVAAELSSEPVAVPAGGYSLGMVDGPNGVQVAFPAEVLAMALRPMVQDWLAKNLPGVVEKLVKEEISKLTQS